MRLLNFDDPMREACEVAGLDLHHEIWWFDDAEEWVIPRVASLLVEKAKASPGAVEFALHMAGMDGCWATDEQRIFAAMIALGKWTAGTAERSGEEQAKLQDLD